jgi:CO dehydrogenase/acetyl-CoA synthase gamma subunit (corrinoid Fe-S protein)
MGTTRRYQQQAQADLVLHPSEITQMNEIADGIQRTVMMRELIAA